MINTLADLLIEVRDAERKIIDARGIKHRPTIGKMFEGLTQSLLNKAIFSGLGLKVINNSFIRIDQKTVSQEFDIMIIDGEGNPIPYTSGQFEVKIEQVIAVIQVKKTLNPQQLEEGYLNLKNVFDISDFDTTTTSQFEMFSDSYQAIAGESVIIRNKLRNQFSSVTHEALFHTLRWEAFLPVRILFSYDGYKTERGIRDAFYNFLTSHKSSAEIQVHGFSPLHFPNLIISGNSSIIKNNALPYVGSMIENCWPFYVSTFGNPMLQLIEILWTRISYRYGLDPAVFGEDLMLEGVNVFLTGNMVNVNGLRGWNFDYKNISHNRLSNITGDIDWKPTKLTNAQHHIIAYLCKNGSLLINKINTCLRNVGLSVEESVFVKELTETGLIYIKDYKAITLSTKRCQTVITKDGIFGADNKTDRLSRWIEKNYPKH